jgi:hypothetical protein
VRGFARSHHSRARADGARRRFGSGGEPLYRQRSRAGFAPLGVTLALPGEFEKLAWFGRGPWENHIDRKAAAYVSRFESTVAEQYVPYIVPQEHGNKTDVRWLSLEDGAVGLRFEYSDATFRLDGSLGQPFHAARSIRCDAHLRLAAARETSSTSM